MHATLVPGDLNVRIKPSAASLCVAQWRTAFISNDVQLSRTKAQSQALEPRTTIKRPRHRFFPAEVQCGNGGAKILAAEKLGKAVR